MPLDQLSEFLDVDTDQLNHAQRILLLAEAYDFEVLAAAEWLHEQYGVEIACARVSLSVDPVSGVEYLTCAQIFPTPELSDHAILRARRKVWENQERSWSAVLDGDGSPVVTDFFRRQIANGCEHRPGQSLFFRVASKRRFWLGPRQTYAYMRQMGRYEGDLEFWSERLSEPESVEQKNQGLALSARLHTAEDFAAFEAALPELAASAWADPRAAVTRAVTA